MVALVSFTHDLKAQILNLKPSIPTLMYLCKPYLKPCIAGSEISSCLLWLLPT